MAGSTTEPRPYRRITASLVRLRSSFEQRTDLATAAQLAAEQAARQAAEAQRMADRLQIQVDRREAQSRARLSR